MSRSGGRTRIVLSVCIATLLMSIAPLRGFGDETVPPQLDESEATTVESNADRASEDALLEAAVKPWTGDFDAMVERRFMRALVTFSKTAYFLDGAQQRGLSYEGLKQFEEEINKKLKTKNLKVHVVFIPVARDELLPALVEGRGDIAAANLTITLGREQLVDFSEPLLTDVQELIVTGPSAPEIEALDDLVGKEVYVRPSSSYYESLQRLNASLREQGKSEIALTPADENLEDEDLLEMVNAGLIPMIVMDSHKAEFWDQIFDSIDVRTDLVVNTGGEIAWAFRKDSPQLKQQIDAFIKTHKKGTLFGNMMFKNYLRNTKWVTNALAKDELARFEETLHLFVKYSAEYGFDWLMVAAQGYQESQLKQSTRSPAGAIGVMQLLPTTAADPNVDILNIELLGNNIHAGVKYLRFLRDRYFTNAEIDPLNQRLFAFAAYNAGPARIAGLREKAQKAGLNPNVWFRNVEVIAAREIGRETVQYVSNIYKYYVAYRLIVEAMKSKSESKAKMISDQQP